MNQSVDNQQRATSTTHTTFTDFTPPKTTDGSYKGAMKHKQALENHLESKFDEEFKRVNARLKEAKTRVSVTRKGNSLQLQATLPPKPDSDKVTSYQQLISLGIPANLEGLQTAYEEANELGKLLARKQFQWNEKWLQVKSQEIVISTIGQLLDNYEEQYFKANPYSAKAVHRIRKYRIPRIKRYCDLDALPTPENFIAYINKVPTDGAKDGLLVAIKQLIAIFKLDIDISPAYFTPKRNRRQIPNDESIEKSFLLFEMHSHQRRKQPKESLRHTWKLKSWMYGMLATFGLRPHELLTHPDIDWWLGKDNLDSTWKVHEHCKTGEREALPLHRQWVELFDLKNINRLNELKLLTNSLTSIENMEYAVQNLAQFFKRIGVPFKPYDLRHAWAIRAHMLGIPIKVAALNLGHGVDIHTRTYQKWFTLDNCKIAIDAAVSKKSENDLMRDEIIHLKLEIERLKIENERYRLGVSFPDILR